MSIITINDIKPDAAGKYSRRLYLWSFNFMRKHRTGSLPSAFLTGCNGVTAPCMLEAVAQRADYISRRHIWIGVADQYDPKWIYGARPSEMANPNITKSTTETWALPNATPPEDITKWFWKMYVQNGRCFVLGDIWHEWIQINRNSRKCRHCGKHERRHVETVRKVVRVDRWRAQ